MLPMSYVINLDLLINAGYPVDVFSIFDSIDSEAETYYHALFNNGDDYRSELEKLKPNALVKNLLIIDSIEIKPKFTKNNIGLFAAKNIIETFGQNCAYFALHPCPLQFGSRGFQINENLKTTLYSNFDEKTSFDKLRSYWQRLGFQEVPESEILVLGGKQLPPEAST